MPIGKPNLEPATPTACIAIGLLELPEKTKLIFMKEMAKILTEAKL